MRCGLLVNVGPFHSPEMHQCSYPLGPRYSWFSQLLAMLKGRMNFGVAISAKDNQITEPYIEKVAICDVMNII